MIYSDLAITVAFTLVLTKHGFKLSVYNDGRMQVPEASQCEAISGVSLAFLDTV